MLKEVEVGYADPKDLGKEDLITRIHMVHSMEWYSRSKSSQKAGGTITILHNELLKCIKMLSQFMSHEEYNAFVDSINDKDREMEAQVYEGKIKGLKKG